MSDASSSSDAAAAAPATSRRVGSRWVGSRRVAVRSATATDARALAGLRWDWRVDERGERAESFETFAAAFAAWMSEHERSHVALLAGDTEGEAVGMAWLAVVHRVPGPQIWHRLAGNLQSVYVRPQWRNRGIGELLVAAVIEQARTLGLDYLSVHPSERSFPLYRRAGFAPSSGVLELRLRGRPAERLRS